MKILIVDDERVLNDSIYDMLAPTYQVDQAFDGETGLFMVSDGVYDLIILDVMMPKMDGFSVLKLLRSQGIATPVLILSARGAIDDKLIGFNRGADDYLVKPFNRFELLVRIQALLRRGSSGLYSDDLLVVNDLVLNAKNRSIRVNQQELNLSGKSFEIFEYLLRNQDQIVTKEQIFGRVWGFDSDTVLSVVEVYMSGIRKELKRCGVEDMIKTVRGLGYIVVSGHLNE